MTKELLFKNLDECLADVEYSFTEAQINFIVEVGYDEMQNWTYRNFRDFAVDVSNEWGDYLYVLKEYDLIPNLDNEEELVKEWFSDHEQAMQDCLAYYDIDAGDSKTLDELFDINLDVEDIVEWLGEHKQAYLDCVRYVLNRKN